MRFRLFLGTFLVGLTVVFVGPLAAHTEVFERAPGLRQVVSGTVDHVDISFWTSVESSEIAVFGPKGEVLDVGVTELRQNGRIATVEFDPITAPGTYTVTHTELADDGDSQTDVYEFIYHPTDGDSVASLFVRDSGPNWVILGAILGVVLVFVGLFWPGRSSKRG